MKRRRKIILIIIAAVAILSVNAYFNYGFYRNYRRYGTIFKPPYKEITRKGNPIVVAIYRFKNDTGLYPCELQDLVPQYLEKVPLWPADFLPEGLKLLPQYFDPRYPSVKWDYSQKYTQGFDLRAPVAGWNKKTRAYVTLRYLDFENRKGWFADERNDLRKIYFAGPRIPAPSISEPQLTSNKLAELDRRIEKTRFLMEKYSPIEMGLMENRMNLRSHYMQKISLLVNTGRLEEAREVCFECIRMEEFRDDYWFWKGIARIDKRLGNPILSEARVRDLCDAQHPGDYFAMFQYYLAIPDSSKALSCVEPLLTHVMSITLREYHWMDLALCAYHSRDYDLCLRICKRWQEYRIETMVLDGYSRLDMGQCEINVTPDDGWGLMSAASYLATGQLQKARSIAEKIITKSKYAENISGGLPQLLNAIDWDDRSFVFLADYEKQEEEKEDFFFDPQ